MNIVWFLQILGYLPFQRFIFSMKFNVYQKYCWGYKSNDYPATCFQRKRPAIKFWEVSRCVFYVQIQKIFAISRPPTPSPITLPLRRSARDWFYVLSKFPPPPKIKSWLRPWWGCKSVLFWDLDKPQTLTTTIRPGWNCCSGDLCLHWWSNCITLPVSVYTTSLNWQSWISVGAIRRRLSKVGIADSFGPLSTISGRNSGVFSFVIPLEERGFRSCTNAEGYLQGHYPFSEVPWLVQF